MLYRGQHKHKLCPLAFGAFHPSLNLTAVNVDTVYAQLLVALQGREVETEGGNVCGQLVGFFLKGHEHAGFAKLRSARTINSIEKVFCRSLARRI